MNTHIHTYAYINTHMHLLSALLPLLLAADLRGEALVEGRGKAGGVGLLLPLDGDVGRGESDGEGRGERRVADVLSFFVSELRGEKLVFFGT
jgi:hypothetical protein